MLCVPGLFLISFELVNVLLKVKSIWFDLSIIVMEDDLDSLHKNIVCSRDISLR